MDKIFKYSTILLLFMTSGLLYLLISLIENPDFRYKIFDFFQFGTSRLFDLVYWKFNSSKENTIWISNYQISPIVNLISSFLWTGLILFIIGFFSKKLKNLNWNQNGFWRRVVITNLIISGYLLLFWLVFVDLDFMYDGVYSKSKSFFSIVYNWLLMIIYLPSLIPGLISSITLDNGIETAQGYHDMFLVTRTMTSFGVTIDSIIVVLIYDKIKNLRNKRKNDNSIDFL